MVNDFGDVNIDGDLLASANGEILALANGCICCTLVDGLPAVLTDLRARSVELVDAPAGREHNPG